MHLKYYLSAKACTGIIRRAEGRGKKLPPLLETALRRQINALEGEKAQPSRICHMADVGQFHRFAFALQGNMIGRADKNGPQGDGVNEDVCFTLNTTDRHAVAYSFDSLSSNSMKSANPSSGCRSVDIAKTIDTTTPCPSKNQGSIAIVERSVYLDVTDPLCGSAAGLNRPAGQCNETDLCIVQEVKDYPFLAVRRLTPTECARLQGFPDWWCSDVPHSDTAEYKMWGNGMALPCVLSIMQNIVSAYRNESQYAAA